MSESDKDLMKFIRKYKEEKNIGRKRDPKVSTQEEQAEDLMSKFRIKDDEFRKYFDLIPEETPRTVIFGFNDLFIEIKHFIKENLQMSKNYYLKPKFDLPKLS